MKLTLNKQEHTLIKQYGHMYKMATGEDYSTHYILTLLSSLYEERLWKDLETVINEKKKAFEEEQKNELPDEQVG